MVRGGKVALICIPPPRRPTPRDLPTFFTWESPSPFQMLPPMGLLEPGQACRVKVTFQPPMAVIYEAQATCWYGEGSKQKSSIQLQAVGEARPLTHPQSPPLHLPGKQSLQYAPPTPALAWPPGDLHQPPALRRAPQALSSLCFPWCRRPVFPWGPMSSLKGLFSLGPQRPWWVSPQGCPLSAQPNAPSCW